MFSCIFNRNPLWCAWDAVPWWAQWLLVGFVLLIVLGLLWRIAALAKTFGGWPAVIGALGIVGTLAAIFLSPKKAIREESRRQDEAHSDSIFGRPRPREPSIPIPEDQRPGRFNRDTGRFNE